LRDRLAAAEVGAAPPPEVPTGYALRHRLPSMFTLREYTVAGGLMSYGENLADFWYRAASFVDKIFKGAKPFERRSRTRQEGGC
jgi:putative tryptophan/tyrosine transport system substrate-binding protein